ncbi:YARHG domain-containing protein [Pseudoramibacter sp.]|jgi:hypothetical protein|uniref:YARHG domain-containing protein n=1 Tax=Pseudoramibacter sp. TaxID=2034862 RepID=UPI0025D287B1|nr:YARHG domain-containing protein [Pseudoramibacter sp.]MCH4071628.1 YARHG domain-containing protein [Pseudoramibacter sp.]MCH4105396.1 YARHG domain-containing protein [Pseudoramibacter sp.]
MKCPHCGAPLEDGQSFCTNCGAPISNQPSPSPNAVKDGREAGAPPVKQPRAAVSNTPVIIVAIICAAAVAVCAMYFLIYKPKLAAQKSAASAKTSQSESSNSGTLSSDASNASSSSSRTSSSRSSSASSNSSLSSNANWMNRNYIIPYSRTTHLTASDIAGFSAKECDYALNEIYAREGRRFNSTELQDYFDSKRWYSGTIDPDDFDDDTMLSGVERDNAEFLRDAVNDRGGYTPQ